MLLLHLSITTSWYTMLNDSFPLSRQGFEIIRFILSRASPASWISLFRFCYIRLTLSAPCPAQSCSPTRGSSNLARTRTSSRIDRTWHLRFAIILHKTTSCRSEPQESSIHLFAKPANRFTIKLFELCASEKCRLPTHPSPTASKRTHSSSPGPRP